MKNPAKVKSLLDSARLEFCFSGYQVYGESKNESFQFSGGHLSYWDSTPVEVTDSTFFDIGSITKVVVATSLIALAVDRGELTVEEFISDRVLEFRSTPFQSITIGDLLAHCSGLKSHVLLDPAAKKSLIRWFCANCRELFECGVREKAVYSDLGPLILGILIERMWGSVSKAYEDRIRGPLKLKNVMYGPVPADHSAATEFSLLEKRLLQGVAFDENTRLLGGVSAHAGLFASAEALSPFAREWLKALKGESAWLSKSVANRFVSRSELVKESTWAFGWDTKSKAFSTAGEHFGPKSFGHLGYPGCSLWIDPEKELVAIFLSNRVHPSRLDERIKRIRPMLHNEIYEVFS